MGQQQLLLVILVTIIVGIATVVAINTFGSAADQANIDAVTNDIATLASAAQGFYMRPAMLGGGSRNFNSGGFNDGGVSFQGLAFPATAIDQNTFMTAQNENGRYIIGDHAQDSFTITANPSSCTGYAPGDVADADEGETAAGDLTGGSDCDAADQITATVTPNNFTINQ